jgi:hypothetical protein
MTAVIATHDLASFFAIGTRAVYSDIESKIITTTRFSYELLTTSNDKNVIVFRSRGTREPSDLLTISSLKWPSCCHILHEWSLKILIFKNM